MTKKTNVSNQKHAHRLTPKGDTLRELFLKSGNLCAFPGCSRLMMSASGAFVGQVCHIEAAEDGGERFNQNMSNEERRAAKNLMLMCYDHHTETNDVAAFPVQKLQQIKSDHEGRFSDPQRAILAELKDWTTTDEPAPAANLRRIDRVLAWNAPPLELPKLVRSLGEYVDRLKVVPQETRYFLGQVAERAHRLRGTNAHLETMLGFHVSCEDTARAFRMGVNDLREHVTQLESHGLAAMDTMPIGEREVDSIYVKSIGDVLQWTEIAHFCAEANEPIGAFSLDLDFSRLDE